MFEFMLICANCFVIQLILLGHSLFDGMLNINHHPNSNTLLAHQLKQASKLPIMYGSGGDESKSVDSPLKVLVIFYKNI